MSASLFDLLRERAEAVDSLLCVGLDPRVPEHADEGLVASLIVEQNKALIEATKDLVLAYKPNIAFYEAHGENGMLALRTTLGLIPDGIPVILDAKRGDIGATSEAYAKAAFDQLGCDAVTVSPYMGSDSLKPFLVEGKGIFVLCKTSNPGSNELQTRELAGDGSLVYEEVARQALSWKGDVGLVVGATDTQALKKLRARHPRAWFLTPGIGAQGATISDTVAVGLGEDGFGLLLVVARSVAAAPDPRAEALKLVEEWRRARDAFVAGTAGAAPVANPLKDQVLRGLVSNGCFKTGEFTLKSGLKSPFYVDLRRVMSDPVLLGRVGRAYASLVGPGSALEGQHFDRIAGIPVAALPLATAMSLATGIPMIFPRLQQKEHGTGNLIEGEFRPGERVLLLDDLITTGKSKVEALEILRAAGLVVDHLVVLLERGAQGRKDMESVGVQLHTFARLEDFLPVCESMGMLDAAERARLQDFASGTGV